MSLAGACRHITSSIARARVLENIGRIYTACCMLYRPSSPALSIVRLMGATAPKAAGTRLVPYRSVRQSQYIMHHVYLNGPLQIATEFRAICKVWSPHPPYMQLNSRIARQPPLKNFWTSADALRLPHRLNSTRIRHRP